LVAASATDSSLYQWSPVPQGKVEATIYVETALAWRDAGSAVPFAIVKLNDGLNDGSDDGVEDGVVIGLPASLTWSDGHGRRPPAPRLPRSRRL